MTKYLLTAALVLSACGDRVDADGNEKSVVRTQDTCEVVTTDPRTGAEIKSEPCDESDLGQDKEELGGRTGGPNTVGNYGWVQGTTFAGQGAASGVGPHCDQAHASPDCIVPIRKNIKFWWDVNVFAADGPLLQSLFTPFINYVNQDPTLQMARWSMTLETNDEQGSDCQLYGNSQQPGPNNPADLSHYMAVACTSKFGLQETLAGTMSTCGHTTINLDMTAIKALGTGWSTVLKHALYNAMGHCLGMGSTARTDGAHATSMMTLPIRNTSGQFINPAPAFTTDEKCLLSNVDLLTNPSGWTYSGSCL